MKKFFGIQRRKGHQKQNASLREKRFSLESLEDRLLLTAVPNGWGLLGETASSIGAGGQTQIGLAVDVSGSDSAVIGILVSAADGSTLDPGAIGVYRADGSEIPASPLCRSFPDWTASSSLLFFEAESGDYQLKLTADGGTNGDLVCSVFLPGDTDGNGAIGYAENRLGAAYAAAWDIHASGNVSLGTIHYYLAEFGIDLTDKASLYNAKYDLNMDGRIDHRDLGIYERGFGASVSVSFHDLFEVIPNNRTVGAIAGRSGSSSEEVPLEADSFTAVYQNQAYVSEGYTVARFVQTDAVRSTGKAWTADCAGLVSFGDGVFTFDASSSLFDRLAAGETLTLSIDYYLDDLTFIGLDQIYQDARGGAVTVTVTGVNDAPRGVIDREGTYRLDSESFDAPVNLLSGVTDPDGDPLTASLTGVLLNENEYGIPADTDFGGCFTVSADGLVGADAGALAALLAPVPAGGSVLLTIGYSVADSSGACVNRTLSLTVIGKNDPPAGVDDAAQYDLASGTMNPEVNLLAGASDPDSDDLTVSIVRAEAAPNRYGIDTDADYAAYFSLDGTGGLTADREALAELLAAVPGGGTVLFTIGYTIADPLGASFNGTVELTVVGQNDAPFAAEDLSLTGALDGDGNLIYTIDLLGNVSDPDGDAVEITGITVDDVFYPVPILNGAEIGGFLYTYSAESGVLTVTATDETADDLCWHYNASDETFLLRSLTYSFTDGLLAGEGTVSLFFEPADEMAYITDVPADAVVVKNASAEAGETAYLGSAWYLADITGYTVAVTVTDALGTIVNTGELADLITVQLDEAVPRSRIDFYVNSALANLLETDAVYTVDFALLYDGYEEDAYFFTFTVKEIEVSPWFGTVSLDEGERAFSAEALTTDAFTAEIGGVEYQSASFSVGPFVQTSASVSGEGDVSESYLRYFAWDSDSGRFVFNAMGSVFDSLAVGQTLTVTFDFYLDDLLFEGYGETFSGIKGGTVTVTVSGTNDAPIGASSYAAEYDLATGALTPEINLLDGVIDPDGDALAASIVSAFLSGSDYGLSPETDYRAFFTVDADGNFGVDAEGLAGLLAPVPAGESVLFTIRYAVADIHGAQVQKPVMLTVCGQNEAPQGAGDYAAVYDLADSAFSPAVNLLDGVTDPDGDALSVSITGAYAQANPYTVPGTDYRACFTVDAQGNLGADAEALAGLFAALPVGQSVVMELSYSVSDPSGAADNGTVTVTVLGSYAAPVFSGEIPDLSGGYDGVLTLDLADYFTGAVAGYTLSLDGNSDILAGYTLEGSVLTLNLLASAGYASALDLSALSATVTASDAFGNTAESNTFAIALDHAETLTISLACVTEEFGGADVKTLRTGTGNFGTFYYVDADAVPQTDYEAIAGADSYYLEVWVNDSSALLTGAEKFFYSLQLQLNYETGGIGITSLDIEDVYAGKISLDNYEYYDDASTMLKAIQVTWLFSADRDWSLLTPITNGENAFLLARFEVTANSAAGIAASGVTDPQSPFVEGYYCVRTGETEAVNDSQIKTVNVNAAKTSSIQGAADAEYVVANGLYLRTVTEKTEVDSSGAAASIGVNADFIHEWQTHYAEIWVKASETDPLSAVSADLDFDNACFDVAGVEFGAAFTGGEYAFDAESGRIVGISAQAAEGVPAGDGYLLLARVTFKAADGPGVLWADSLSPVQLSRTLTSATVVTASGTADAYIGAAASSDLWVNPYDVNDDGEINLIDFVAFVNQYGGNSAESDAGAFFDFNRDGAVDVRDFTAFSNVYGITRRDLAEGKAELAFPESFTRRYIGSTLDADNARLLGPICDAAVSAWSEALGTDEKIDLRIVVKDLPDAQLAMAQVTQTDPVTGAAVRGTIYLDDDAAGARWSALLTPPPAGSSRYDLYTVILHELGHLYGYNAANSAFASVASGFEWVSADGHSTVESDLMYPFIEQGTRKNITVRDAAVVAALQQAARENAEKAADEAFAAGALTAAAWQIDFAELAETGGQSAESGLGAALSGAFFDDELNGDF